MKEMLLRNLVEIKWVDSNTGDDAVWEYLSDLESLEPVQCNSVGYLVEDNKDYKTLAQSVSHTQVLGRITIPIGSIESIVDVRTGKFLFHSKNVANEQAQKGTT